MLEYIDYDTPARGEDLKFTSDGPDRLSSLVNLKSSGGAAAKSWHTKPITLNLVEVAVLRKLPGFSRHRP